MAKINRRRLSKVISVITALVLFTWGVWLLTLSYEPFSSKYFDQRNVEHIEAKYGKPYKIYREEEKAACIARAQQLPVTSKDESNWLSSLSEDKDVINKRISICDFGTTEIEVTKMETVFSYLKSLTFQIILFLISTFLVSWFVGTLFTKWLPHLIASSKHWLTTDDESGS